MMAMETDLNDLYGSLSRRRILILSFVIVAVLVGFAVSWMSPRKYEAQARIMLQPSEAMGILSRDEGRPAGPPPAESVILSEVEILRSRDLAEMVIQDLGLVDDPIFWQGQNGPAQIQPSKQNALELFSRSLGIRPVSRSLVIEVSYRHVNAELTARIVNRLIQIYQEQQVKQKLFEARQANEWLQKRMNQLAAKLRDSARAVESYRAKEDLIDGAKAELTSQQISEIGSQLVTAKAELAAAKAKKHQINTVIENKRPLDTVGDISRTRLISILKHDEAVLQAQYAELSSKYGPNHPRIRALQAELGDLKTKKNTEISRVGEAISNEVLAMQAKVETLESSLHEMEQKRRRENQAAIGLRALQREADADKALYESFLSRQKQISVTGDMQQPDAKIISLARTPMVRAGFPRSVIILIAGNAGLLLGILMALILERLDSHIRTPLQLEQMSMDIPTLAMIPNVPRLRRKSLASYVQENPYTPVAESLRGLRIRLSEMIVPGQCKVVTVTSCLPGEGKTTLTLSLARLLAQAGYKVLLIDGDFRRPSLATKLGLTVTESVADAFIGKKSEAEFITQDTEFNNLSIMAGKKASQNDIATMSLGTQRALLTRLKSGYDMILIDGAPLLSVSETHFLMTSSDFCLFNIRWDHVPVDIMRTAIKQLKNDKINVGGFVISRVDLKAHALYRYNDISQYYGRYT